MLSNAFEKSTKIGPVMLPLSMNDLILSAKHAIAVSVERPALKPNWHEESMLNILKYLNSLT